MLKNFLKRFELVSLSIILAFSLVFFSGCSSSDDTKYVYLPEETTGTIVGTAFRCIDEVDENMLACRGIPYAESPVEDLRFAPPEPANLSGIIDATKFGSECPQLSDGTPIGDEDCLTLNIFVPKDPSENETGYPVMVWFHGGAFIQGSGSVPAYDMPDLVKRGLIVVTVNYRLGALGFLPHPALTAEAEQSGNYGLMDQQLALGWVQKYISGFGGNAENVTIFGESAGGHSVLSHLVAPGSADLFDKAIVQSGSYSPMQLPMTSGYFAYGRSFADVSGVPAAAGAPCAGISVAEDVRQCLRGLTRDQILAAQGDTMYVPVTGGAFLPQSIDTRLQAGTFHIDKPVLIGSNLNEGTLFTALYYAAYAGFAAEASYQAAVVLLLATDWREWSEEQRLQIANDYVSFAEEELGEEHPNLFRRAYSKIWTDYFFTCNNLNQWEQLSAYTPTYAYWFTDTDAPIPPAYAMLAPLEPAITFGASHSFEIQYVFGRVQEHTAVTADQIALSEQMIDFWAEFAKTGQPGGAWQEYADGGSFVMELDTPGASGTDASDFGANHRCAYWADPFAID